MKMIRNSTLVIILFLIVAEINFAQQEAPYVINPDTLRLISPAGYPQFAATWITGNAKVENIYIFRIKLEANAQIPPFKHPDIRYGTVLSGTLYIGFGKRINESAMVEVQSGEVYYIPADVTHYIKAGNDEVIYQEIGVGPTATTGTAIFK